MNTNKLNTSSAVQKLLISVGVLIVVALVGVVLSSTFENNKDVNSIAKNTHSLTGSTQQENGINTAIPVWTPLKFSYNDNKNTGAVGTNDNSPKKPATQTPNTPTTTKPPVAKPGKTKLAAVTAAENQTYTSDNRLFVTGENGIFEIIPGANGNVTVVQRAPKQKCAFGGIVETNGVLYVNCSGNGLAYVYAARVTAEPSFQRIYKYKSAILPNGLTADSSGRLYAASTFFGQILRLIPSVTNPLTFSQTGLWRNGTGPATNGIKFANNFIYWTDSQFVNRVAIKADGAAGKQERVLSVFTFFDDLSVDNNGILLADYIKGVIRSYDLSGHSTSIVSSGLSGPSSVMRARAPFPTGALIVTERARNQVTLVTP